jgi:SWI/SNF-related matrix-associated actin-dependent regulator 1 of chromatin subfamily A
VLQVHPKRRDWFLVPLEEVKHLFEVPILRMFDDTHVELPRSVLPLWPEGKAFLDNRLDVIARDFEERCNARDAATRPRGFTLRTHQHAGVEFTEARRGSLVADAPRVGKTALSLMSHDPTRGKLVAIAPLSTRAVWKGWIDTIFPGVEVSIITGRNFSRAKLAAPIVLGHYDVLGAWQDLNLKIGTLILDEAHALSNRRSQRTKAAAFMATRADKVVALTGTPLWNRPQSLWPLLGLVAPGQFGNFHEFAFRYTNATPNAFGWDYAGTANEAELKQRLSEVMICRRWADIKADLPTVTRDTILVDLTPKQRLTVDLAAESARGNSGSTSIGALAKYRATLSKLKIGTAIDYVREDLDRDERVVLWTWHKASAQIAHDALKTTHRSFLVTGAIAPAKRDAILDEWRRTPAAALVITIAVGQVGIDLSAARLAVFAEIDFTPALIAQAEMRTFSPLRPMNVRYIVADHPVEHALIAALTRKLDNSDSLGIPAAEAAIDVLKQVFALPDEAADMSRLLNDLLSSVDTDG